MLFYDFEVFKEDWLVVIVDMNEEKEYVIINDREELLKLYEKNKKNIWIGYNSNYYDQYILKAILCDFNPKEVNDFIIIGGESGFKYSKLFNEININSYDVMLLNDGGLKTLEGYLGNDIKESKVDFNIGRKLTDVEIQETIKYCRHDVEQTIEVFLKRKDDFNAQMGLIKLASNNDKLNLSLLSKSKPQISSKILNARRVSRNDEFEIDFPNTLSIKKYKEVVDWYRDVSNHDYKKSLKLDIANVNHTFGWGGLHGAIPKYMGTGYFINMDVASLYPSLMIQYNLHSRNMKDPKKYEEIYYQRLKYKAEKNPLQSPLKLVLNSTYGVMKDKNNPLYDPLQANRVCVYGQLLLLDLIEKLENHCQIIQSNTDGILIKLNKYEDFELIDDICYQWEKRTKLKLEFDEYSKVFQKDVNNYVIVNKDRKYKSIGAYVKKLNDLDYNLPIVNKALINYLVQNVSIEDTINNCNSLKEFQIISKITSKYSYILHGDKRLKERCIRLFASNNKNNNGVYKIHKEKQNLNKIPNSPEYCFIINDNINGFVVPNELDKNWYIDLAHKRLKSFGVV